MKIKIFRKILAVTMVASTVMLMSGFAVACQNGEGGKSLKTGENQYVKVDKNKDQNEDEPKKQGQSFNLDDEISKLNSLLKGYSAKPIDEIIYTLYRVIAGSGEGAL